LAIELTNDNLLLQLLCQPKKLFYLYDFKQYYWKYTFNPKNSEIHQN